MATAKAKKISCYYYKKINGLYYPIVIHGDMGYQMVALPPFDKLELMEAWVKGRNRNAGLTDVEAFKIKAAFIKAENENGKEVTHG